MGRRFVAVLAGVLWFCWLALSAPLAAPPQSSPAVPLAGASHAAVVKQYCVTCHNSRTKTGDLVLEGLDLASVASHTDIWEKVIRKLRTGAMPPQGVPRPDLATTTALLTWLEAELDRATDTHPGADPPLLHRLNRAEYANAIRDLLMLDVDPASLLPPDDSAYGFDNVADALGVSPVLLERYVVAAGTIAALAIGDRHVSPGSETYRIRQDLSQDQHIEGLPLGTVGGALIRHFFPVAGEYVLQAKLFRTNTDAMRGLEYPHQIEMTLDGERIFLTTVGGGQDWEALFTSPTPAGDAIDARLKARVSVKAGPREVGITFLQRTGALDTRRLRPFLRSSADTYDYTGRPHITQLTIVGPFNAAGSGDTPSRRKILTCRPATPAAEAPCAKSILSVIARRAYRRPVTETDLKPILGFYESGRKEGGFEAGIQAGLERILASPSFVFRAEPDPAQMAPGTPYRLGDLELASRLSFFLWSSIPDDQLLALASQRKLATPAVLASQVRRMLADPKAKALATNFAGQWLQLRNLRNIVPNSEEFPDFDDNLRQAFLRETELFFDSIVQQDRNVLDLLTADYTFVNERLAKHYGIPGVAGSHFRRVAIARDERRGLLGHGSVLTVTSHVDRTSPVVRGKWILDNLVGTPPPPPPPNVPALEATPGTKFPTLRARLEAHRSNPACAGCHRIMDPMGFALENFDAVGAWRTTDAGQPINASGELQDGTQVDGVVTLRAALLKRPEVFVTTLTEKLMTYALGRGLDSRDMPMVRSIVREAARRNYQFSALIQGIVASKPFQVRVAQARTPGERAQAAAP